MKNLTVFSSKTVNIILIFTLIIISIGCAEVVPIKECIETEPYGFWYGLWHGIIAPFTFIVSLFSDTIAMYAVNNNGAWYDFGFVIGAGILFGSGKRASRKTNTCC